MLLDEWCGTLYNGWELTSYDSKHTVICLIGPPRHGTVAEKTVQWYSESPCATASQKTIVHTACLY